MIKRLLYLSGDNMNNLKRKLKIIKKMITPSFLRINESYNSFFRILLLHSHKIRAKWYAEGGDERPSHDHDISLYYRWELTGFDFWNKVAAFCGFSMINIEKK